MGEGVRRPTATGGEAPSAGGQGKQGVVLGAGGKGFKKTYFLLKMGGGGNRFLRGHDFIFFKKKLLVQKYLFFVLKICRIILLSLLVLPGARPGPRPGPPGFQEQLVAPHPVEVAHGDAGEFDRGLRLQHGGRHHGVLEDLAHHDAKGLGGQGQAGDEQGEPESIYNTKSFFNVLYFVVTCIKKFLC